MAVMAYVGRDMWRNDANRRMLYILFAISGGIPFFRLIAALVGLGVHESLVVELLFFSFASVCIAINSYRRILIVAAIFAAGALLSSVFVGEVLRITAAINLLAGFAIAFLWGGPRVGVEDSGD